MKKIINIFLAALVCVAFNQTAVFASSHREAPLISTDPLADNTDLYAFRSPGDSSKIILIANYIPFEHPAGGPNWYSFGEKIRYEIHIKNNATTPGDDITYRFLFTNTNEDPTTFFNIRLGKQNGKGTYKVQRSMDGGKTFITIGDGVVAPPNIGPRSIQSGVGLGAARYDAVMYNAIKKCKTGERVYCGPADDPFFVDLGGAFDVGGFRQPGVDGLAKFNCHSICVEVPISTLQKDGKTTAQATSILDPNFVIGVYASASRKKITTFDSASASYISASDAWVQVSRLGMPLTNEVIIPVGSKDKWNATSIKNDLQFAPYFENPELGLYMDDSQFGTAVPGLKALRIQSNSLGSFDFRNGKAGLFSLKGSPAVAGTALDDAIFGNILLPDNHSPRAVDLLPIFYTGVPNLAPYQLATGKGGNPLAAGKPFINNFLPTLNDMLRLNMAVPVTPRNSPDFSSDGIINAAVLGLTDARFNGNTSIQFIPNMDGFPNGRRLEDDVTTIELQAVSGVALAAIGLWYDDYTSGSPVTPDLVKVLTFNAGVTHNDTTFKKSFPFVQAPWRGFNGPGYTGPVSAPLLPGKLTFNADKGEQAVNLRWQVDNEPAGTDHYNVEASTDGVIFTTIGAVKASGGLKNTYALVDSKPLLEKINYYRIKQVSAGGNFTYSPVKAVEFSSRFAITITPNPAHSYLNVYAPQEGTQVNIYDVSGRLLTTKKVSNGSAVFSVASYAKGIYTVVAKDKNGKNIETQKIVVE